MFDAPTLDEMHITLEQFEDEITYEPDGTAVLFGGDLRHRCPDGTPCTVLAAASSTPTTPHRRTTDDRA